MSEPSLDARALANAEPVWWGWRRADERAELPAAVRALLVDGLGFAELPSPPVELADVRLAPSRLPEPARADLAAALGAQHVLLDRDARIRHCRGRSTADLLALRAGDASAAPDAVLTPADHDEVAAVLAVCAGHRVAVVPYGGGTSVVGGLTPPPSGYEAVVALDLGRLNRLLDVDTVSLTATLEPGLSGPAAEALLAEHGLTLGHIPQSWEYATIGGFAATRSSGQASSGYGRFDAVVVGLRVATPIGGWELGRAPASAAGPDLRQLVLGSEGAFGVITAVRVRVRPVAAHRHYESWRVEDFATGLAALRELAQRDLLPTVARLSDEVETAAGATSPPTAAGAPAAQSGGGSTAGPGNVGPDGRGPERAGSAGYGPAGDGPAGVGPAGVGPAGVGPAGVGPAGVGPAGVGPAGVGPAGVGPGGEGSADVGSAGGGPERGGPGGADAVPPGGCQIVFGYEGTPERVGRQIEDVAAVLRAHGGRSLGAASGWEWVRGRFYGPRLRDALLDAGMFAETLETAAFWSGVDGLYDGVREALAKSYAVAGVPAVVLCHVSHLYPTGASLYFTVVAGHSDDRAALWSVAKAAASDAIVAAGGTITHHHAVGTDHRPWLGAEIGDVGVTVLRAVKRSLDPTGILNPGVLIP